MTDQLHDGPWAFYWPNGHTKKDMVTKTNSHINHSLTDCGYSCQHLSRTANHKRCRLVAALTQWQTDNKMLSYRSETVLQGAL